MVRPIRQQAIENSSIRSGIVKHHGKINSCNPQKIGGVVQINFRISNWVILRLQMLMFTGVSRCIPWKSMVGRWHFPFNNWGFLVSILVFGGVVMPGKQIRHSEEEIGDGERVGIRSEYYWPQEILHCPRCSMYGLFTYICVVLGVNVGKYSIHWASGCGHKQFATIFGRNSSTVGSISNYLQVFFNHPKWPIFKIPANLQIERTLLYLYVCCISPYLLGTQIPHHVIRSTLSPIIIEMENYPFI